MIKFLSLFLSFSLLFTTVAPSYAQAVSSVRAQRSKINLGSRRDILKQNYVVPQDNTRVVRPKLYTAPVKETPKNNSDEMDKLTKAVEKQAAAAAVKGNSVEAAIAYIEQVLQEERQRAEEYRRRGGATIGPAQSTSSRYVTVLPRLDFIYEGTPSSSAAYHKKTLPRQTWAWAGLRMDLKGLSSYKMVGDWDVETSWNRALGREEYMSNGNVIGSSTQVVKAISTYGVSDKDEELARTFLTQMLQRDGLCEQTGSRLKAGNAQNEYEFNLHSVPLCQYSTQIMEALAVLAVQYKDNKAVDAIYNYMVSKHREALAPMVVMQGVALLQGINTDYSYGKLKSFLRDVAKQNGGDKFLHTISYISFEGLGNLAQEQTSSGKHLDNYTARYAYLDTDTAKKYYPNLDLNIVTKQPLTTDGKYQLPMGNVYEDIGVMLATDNNPRSAALAKDILTSGNYSWPLVTGVLFANEGQFAASASADKAAAMWQHLLQADYTDMNEGTQRRMKSAAANALLRQGLISQEQSQPYFAKDNNKFARYQRQEKVNFGLGALDILTILVTLPMLVKSVAQGSVKAIAKLRNFGKASASAAKKSGVVTHIATPTAPRAAAPAAQANAGRQAAAVSAQEASRVGQEWLNAAKELDAAKKAQEAAWVAAQAEKDAARAAAAAEQTVTTAKTAPAAAVTSTPRSPAWVQTEGVNALGQTVQTWRPVNPINPGPKPSLWNNWWQSTKDWGTNLLYDTKQLFGDLASAAKRQTAAAALTLSLNFTPVPSTAVQTVLRAESAITNTVRTEQVFTGTRSLIQEGSTLARTFNAPAFVASSVAPSVSSLQTAKTLGTVAAGVEQTSSALSFAKPLMAGMSLPFSTNVLMPFVPVAVTPEMERQLGMGNFFKFKTGKPQFLNDYLKELNAYEKLQGFQAPQQGLLSDPAYASFSALQTRKMQHSLKVNATDLYWQQQGYPITGKIQNMLQNGAEGAYLYTIAPWLYRKNPYYQQYQASLASVQPQAAATQAATAEQDNTVADIKEQTAETVLSATETAAQEQAAQEIALAAETAAASVKENTSTSSGYLYSGIPVFAIANLFKKVGKELIAVYVRSMANASARSTLKRLKPLATELRDILNSPAAVQYKEKALVKLYKDYSVFDQVIETMPEETQNRLAASEKLEDESVLGKTLYSMYTMDMFAQPLAHLSNHIPLDEYAQELEEIIASPDFKAESHIVYDDTPVLSAESNLFTGVVQSLQEVNREAILESSRPKGWAKQNAAEGHSVKGGWIYFENDVPVYYRYANGELSSSPVAVLHQEPSSWYASVLALFGASTKKGFKVPKGMVLALDENGKFKYVRQPGHLAELATSKAARKVLDNLYGQGSVSVEFDTPYSTTDLLAMAKMLEASPNINFQITLNKANSFKQFVNMLGMFFGLNVDSVMVAPFKKAASADASPTVEAVAPNVFGGVGYVTPRAAGELVPHMQKWGMDKSTFTILAFSLATLLLSTFSGINGMTPTSEFSLMALALPMVVLVLASSLLRSSAPLLLNHYKDPQMRTAANLQMSTYQQLARVLLAGVTFLWPKIVKGGNDFVAVPAAALLATITLGLFVNTSMWDNVKADIIKAWKHPGKALAKVWEGLKTITPSLLKGLGTGVAAPLIDLFNAVKNKLSSAPKTYANTDEGRYKEEYDKEFLTQQETKDSLMRVTLAYASYAASVMLLNQVAGTSLGTWGQAAVTAFAVASLFVRRQASKWVEKGKFTDDQLTGISFTGLALAPLALAVLPYDGGWMSMVGLVLAGIGLNMSTAVPGQLDNTRLQNNVTATMQERKNQVLQNNTLTTADKEAQIADLEKMEKYWAGWASKNYSQANANGIYGIYAAVLASGVLSMISPDASGWAARLIFLYSGIVAAVGAWNTRNMAASFARAFANVIFGKQTLVKISEKDLANNSVSYKTFGLSTDTKKANTMLVSLWKGKKDSIKTLKNKLAPYGVVTMASEVKMVSILNRMIAIQNRLVALSEVLGMDAVRPAFADLLALSKDYQEVLKQSNLSESLTRQFAKLQAALCVNGSLEQGVAEKPTYMTEGDFGVLDNYRDFMRAKDLINELDVLAKNIKRGGSAVTAETYAQFVRYHTWTKQLLQKYAETNPAESGRVKVEEDRLRNICRSLKASNARANTLRKNAGKTSAEDVQLLEDILQAY